MKNSNLLHIEFSSIDKLLIKVFLQLVGTRGLDGNSGPVGPIQDPKTRKSHGYKMDGVQPYL